MVTAWVSDLAPGLLGIGVFAIWSKLEAGFEPTTWYPGTLFLLGALLATAVAVRSRPIGELPRRLLLATALLAAFTAWSFLSITWADVPADAWDAANRTLLYLVVFVLFAIPRWSARGASALFGLYSVALAVVIAITLAELTAASDPARFFIDGRLVEPAGYQNAVAALLVGGLWPALLLASRRETPWPLRGAFLAIAGLLVQVALLPQSRGAVIVLPLALILYFAVVPSRLRALATIVPLAAVTSLTAPRLLDVYDAVRADEDAIAAIDRAVVAVGLGCLALLAVGVALALVDQRVRLSARARLLGGRISLALALLAVLAGGIAGLAAVGNPVSWAGDRFDDFKGGYDESFETNRFSGDLGSNRYDFWRVGLGTTFADSPLIGAGADNFATDYLLERRSTEEPRYPHSLPVRILAGTGLIGALLFGGFLLAAVLAAIDGTRRQPPGPGRALGSAGLVAVAYLFMHSAGDWLFSFPAVTAPAFAWLGMIGGMTALSARQPASSSPGGVDGAGVPPPRAGAVRAGAGSWLSIGLAASLSLLAAASLVAPWLAARHVEGAAESWVDDPTAAYERLDHARSLNPLSARPDLVAGAIAGRLGDLGEAKARFAAAVEREPGNWYALLELAVATGLEGDRAGALSLLERARSANPRDPLIADVARRFRAGEAVTFARIERDLQGRLCLRIGRAADAPVCWR